MAKNELKIGDAVYMPHEKRVAYTYVSNPSNSDYSNLRPQEVGIFAYNPPPTLEIKFVQLPFDAVIKID